MLLKAQGKFLKSLAILYSLLSFSFLHANNNIITSVYPLKLFLKELVPNNVKVINIIPINSNPHFFEPTPSTIKLVEKADIFIGVQKDFDGWIEKNLNKNAYKYYLNPPHRNPHIWLSPKTMLKHIDIIKQILTKKFPENKEIICKKASQFQSKLKILIQNFKLKFSKIKNKNIIEIHPAFDYLAYDFNLNIVDVVFISEHQTLSIKHYLKLIKEVKKYNIKLILYSSNIHSNIINNLKNDLNVNFVEIDPLGSREDSYLSYIEKILNKILISFKKCQINQNKHVLLPTVENKDKI